eukprot:6201108-Pleurochrysis_carterae.AAC.1
MDAMLMAPAACCLRIVQGASFPERLCKLDCRGGRVLGYYANINANSKNIFLLSFIAFLPRLQTCPYTWPLLLASSIASLLSPFQFRKSPPGGAFALTSPRPTL